MGVSRRTFLKSSVAGAAALSSVSKAASQAGSTDLHYLSIAEAAELIRTRRLSPLELTQAILDRIDQVESKVLAFVTVALTGSTPGPLLTRSAARPGDQVAVTGKLGASGAWLAATQQGMTLAPLDAEALSRAHLRPRRTHRWPRLGANLRGRWTDGCPSPRSLGLETSADEEPADDEATERRDPEFMESDQLGCSHLDSPTRTGGTAWR